MFSDKSSAHWGETEQISPSLLTHQLVGHMAAKKNIPEKLFYLGALTI